MKLRGNPRTPPFWKIKAEELLLGLLSMISIERVIRSFLLNCRVEQLSPKTISAYEGNLGRFLWFARRDGYPEIISDITPDHIRHFLVYVGSEGRALVKCCGNSFQHPFVSSSHLPAQALVAAVESHL